MGARGAISVAAMAGKAILEHGAAGPSGPSGMLTGIEPFNRLPFTSWGDVVFGGCDVTDTPLVETFESHMAAQIIPNANRAGVRESLEAVEPGIVNLAGVSSSPAARLRAVREALAAFRSEQGLGRVLVLSCASTEPLSPLEDQLAACERWEDLEAFLAGCAEPLPWGVVYATASLLEGCAYVNFTPNLGTELPALLDLAGRRGLPHAGKDGKTGETLLKSVLAPMFAERDLRVLAWQSYNMLGNNDGLALSDPKARAAKIRSKDRQLRSILTNSPDLHTQVSIDYVPSLGDWKTAWNLVHFEGFLGTRMSFNFTWNGCDTALAAPLLLDLIRFVELAWRNGEHGHLGHLDAYFKSPTGCQDHDFRHQMARLYQHYA